MIWTPVISAIDDGNQVVVRWITSWIFFLECQCYSVMWFPLDWLPALVHQHWDVFGVEMWRVISVSDIRHHWKRPVHRRHMLEPHFLYTIAFQPHHLYQRLVIPKHIWTPLHWSIPWRLSVSWLTCDPYNMVGKLYRVELDSVYDALTNVRQLIWIDDDANSPLEHPKKSITWFVSAIVNCKVANSESSKCINGNYSKCSGCWINCTQFISSRRWSDWTGNDRTLFHSWRRHWRWLFDILNIFSTG